MAGQQFQYDDSGNTFFYFLTSFVGLIVIPATYYLWPRDQNAGESGRRLAPLRSAPGRAAPHGPAGRGRTLRVRVTPPGQRGLGRGRGRGPPAWSAGVWLGSAPRRCGRPSPAASLSPRPGLCFCWVSFLLQGAGWAGTGWGRGKSWPRRTRSLRAQLRITLRSRPPASLSSRCPRCSCRCRCWGPPQSRVARLGLPSELTSSSPPPPLPPLAAFFFSFFFFSFIQSHRGGCCRYSFYKSKNRCFFFFFFLPPPFPFLWSFLFTTEKCGHEGLKRDSLVEGRWLVGSQARFAFSS